MGSNILIAAGAAQEAFQEAERTRPPALFVAVAPLGSLPSPTFALMHMRGSFLPLRVFDPECDDFHLFVLRFGLEKA